MGLIAHEKAIERGTSCASCTGDRFKTPQAGLQLSVTLNMAPRQPYLTIHKICRSNAVVTSPDIPVTNSWAVAEACNMLQQLKLSSHLVLLKIISPGGTNLALRLQAR